MLTNGVKRLTNVFKTYTDDLTKIAEMVYGVTDEVTRLGCSMIAEEWESYDELLRERKDLRQGWYIVRRDETSLLTSLGEVVYHKTLFKNVATGESCYLLDQLMGLGHHARITEDAEARILLEASESSYRKGGASASINGESISKEAVMNKLHRLEFPALKTVEKKELRTLYIDADEDHVALQYLEKKGDIRNPRINTVMPWIIYVYEGVEGDEEGRPHLINPKYFGGVYDGQEAGGIYRGDPYIPFLLQILKGHMVFIRPSYVKSVLSSFLFHSLQGQGTPGLCNFVHYSFFAYAIHRLCWHWHRLFDSCSRMLPVEFSLLHLRLSWHDAPAPSADPEGNRIHR